jgi:hypothetical protein
MIKCTLLFCLIMKTLASLCRLLCRTGIESTHLHENTIIINSKNINPFKIGKDYFNTFLFALKSEEIM